MNDRELLEFIAAQVGNLTQDVAEIKKGQKVLDSKIDSIENTIVRMENDNNMKFTALFDGYKQNAEKLERIEKEVTKQEEIIMRRVK